MLMMRRTTAGLLAVLATSAPVIAKTPGQTYCHHGVCHRVLTVEEAARAVGRTETVVASFYDDPRRDASNPNIMTSSGERFDPGSDRTVASPIYPNGTRLLLWSPINKAAIEVRVTNSGPYHGSRRIDVSPRAAERLGFKPLGVSPISVTVLAGPTHEEAKYQKGRTYAPVTGYLGHFETLDRARLAAAPGTLGTASRAAGAPAMVSVATGSIGKPSIVANPRAPLQRAVPSGQPAVVQPTAAALAVRDVKKTAPAASPAQAWPRADSPSNWATTLTESEPRSAIPRQASPARALGLR
jgi:rare lipoprotein A